MGCLKACWEKREQMKKWRKQSYGGGREGYLTRTEPRCKCLRTCPLGWSEWQRKVGRGERSENAACTVPERF